MINKLSKATLVIVLGMLCFSLGVISVPRGYRIIGHSGTVMKNLDIVPVRYQDKNISIITIDEHDHTGLAELDDIFVQGNGADTGITIKSN